MLNSITNDRKMEVDRNIKCHCDKREPIVVNYDLMWHDGDVVCKNCKGYIRDYDAG